MEKEFENSFERIYEATVISCKDRLKDVKTKNNKFLLMVLIVLTIINLIVLIIPSIRFIISLTISVSVAILIYLYIVGSENYKRIYKECVIEKLVKSFCDRFYYDLKTGITRAEYNMSHFDERHNQYKSEDRIFGTLENGDNFQISEVNALEVIRKKDSSGKIQETKKETFRGIYGIVRLQKNTLLNIHIASDNYFKRFIKNRVEVDSSEFEKYYDCLTSDKVDAMRIFTSELIEKYIEIVRDNKYGFELKIVDNMIFFRYKTNQLFEPPMFKSGLDKDFMKKNYKVIYYPLEIMKSTIDCINEIVE